MRGSGSLRGGREADVAGEDGGKLDGGEGVARADEDAGGGALEDVKGRTGSDAEGVEAAESGAVVVCEAGDDVVSGRDGGERGVCGGGEFAGEGRDAVAVGVEGWIAKLGGDALFEALADEMLEALGLVVDLVEGVIEDLEEEGFEEAMVAEDLEGAETAGFGEADAAVALVVHKGVG